MLYNSGNLMHKIICVTQVIHKRSKGFRVKTIVMKSSALGTSSRVATLSPDIKSPEGSRAVGEEAYDICIGIYGECKCAIEFRSPCDAIISLLDNGESASSELERIEDNRIDAAQECEW